MSPIGNVPVPVRLDQPLRGIIFDMDGTLNGRSEWIAPPAPALHGGDVGAGAIHFRGAIHTDPPLDTPLGEPYVRFALT